MIEPGLVRLRGRGVRGHRQAGAGDRMAVANVAGSLEMVVVAHATIVAHDHCCRGRRFPDQPDPTGFALSIVSDDHGTARAWKSYGCARIRISDENSADIDVIHVGMEPDGEEIGKVSY